MDSRAPSNASSSSRAFFTRERAGVSLLFLMNGFMIGAWAPKIPEFASRLGLSESSLGLMILTFGLGSLLMMPLAGSQIARFGSSQVAKYTSVLLTPTLLLLTWVGSIWSGAVAIFLFGGLIGAMDVAMNANAVSVEKSMRRAIMSSCHAFWSLGGLIGSSTGGFLIEHIGVSAHAILVTVLAAVMIIAAWPTVLHDAPHPDEAKHGGSRLPLSPLPWLIGIMALFCMIPEGAILDWGALYLRNELAASVTLSGFAFAAFSLTMAAMRFAGDLIRDRFGAVMTLRVCAVISIFGLLLIGFAQNAPMAIAGFALTGIGISNIVPIAFSAAGNLPGMAAGVGLSVVTTMGYSGILVAPSAIGFIAEHTGLAAIFAGLSALIIVVLVLSPLARHADTAHH
ncbi:MFS transporter [Neorhizobium sp. BETTINA12A]|uniref:MFS transporter n=1 Tax=Neorhizobium sp. BETTINA12A TaxID=2908924 RepID=UPI001FF581D0|nr:MFS transporter [Neorhizobium sp. BETTINA12A]MCJ9751611.1 MFS transporter [Neorhizobium sp. BETTINA12A]